MEKQNLIKKINELLESVEPMKFSLEISTNENEIDFLVREIKSKYVEINDLREKLELVRGI